MFCVLELQQDIYLFTSALTLSMPVYRACKENIFSKCQLNSCLNVPLMKLQKKLLETAETLELPRRKLDNLNPKEMCSLFFYC